MAEKSLYQVVLSSNGVIKISLDLRKKANDKGIDSLNDYELLALILNVGTKNENVLELSKRYIKEKGGLKNIFLGEIILNSKGVNESKVYLLLAIRELYKRIFIEKSVVIDCSILAYEYTKNLFFGLKNEMTVILYLGRSKDLLMMKKYDLGMEMASLFPVEKILKEAILLSSHFVIVLHNHPSGCCYPSLNDEEASILLYERLFQLSILLLDSLVITDDGYFSLRDEKIKPFN